MPQRDTDSWLGRLFFLSVKMFNKYLKDFFLVGEDSVIPYNH